MSPDGGINLALSVHRGEEGSTERLVRAYQDQLYSFALRLLRNSFDAEEVAQDTFLRAHRALTNRYDEATCRSLQLRPWLFRITHNLAHSRLRGRRQQIVPIDDAGVRSAGHDRVDPGTNLENRDRRDLLDSAMDQLSSAARELIALRFLEELSYAEIAGVTGTTESSARGKAFRALRELRRLLADKEGNHALQRGAATAGRISDR